MIFVFKAGRQWFRGWGELVIDPFIPVKLRIPPSCAGYLRRFDAVWRIVSGVVDQFGDAISQYIYGDFALVVMWPCFHPV